MVGLGKEKQAITNYLKPQHQKLMMRSSEFPFDRYAEENDVHLDNTRVLIIPATTELKMEAPSSF